MPLELGDQNLISFVNSGFEHLHVTPNINSMYPGQNWFFGVWTRILWLDDSYQYCSSPNC